MSADLKLRNLAQTLGTDEQENFNYWVNRFAFDNKISTDEALQYAIIKQENMKYTGKFNDYSEEK